MRERGPERAQGSSLGALAAAAAAAVLLGTTGTASALGPDELGAEAAAAWRALIGGIALVAAAAATGRAPWRYRLAVPCAGAGALAVAANQLAFFAGIERNGVAVGTLVTVGAVPVTAGLLELFDGRRPPAGWAGGVLVAVVGVGLLTGADSRPAWAGLAFSAASGAAGALAGFSAQRLTADRPMLPAMATVVGGGGLLLAPVAARDAGIALGTAGAVATVAFLGLATMGLAYGLWGEAMRHLGLGVAAAATLLEPAVAAVLAAAVLDEPVTAASAAGITLVLAGVALASHRSSLREGLRDET